MNAEAQPHDTLLDMLGRALTAQAEAQADARIYADRVAALAEAQQRALVIAYLAKLNHGMVDPKTLIDCLTGRDTPHELRAAG